MLSCSACRASLTALKTVARYGLRLSNSFRIGLATSSRHSSTNADDFPTLRQETLTVVYKVSKFILSQTTDSDSSTRFVPLWDWILSRIRQDLTTENARPIRVVVCPLDEWSASQQLVMALLADPFSSDENYTKNLNDRWKYCDRQQLKITYNPLSTLTDDSLALPSAYLKQFSTPIEIIEFDKPTTKQGESFQISQALEHSTEADISILVFNPLVTSLSIVSASHLPFNSIIVVSAGIPQHELDEVLRKHQSHTRSSLSKPQFLAIEPRRAAKAISNLQREPNTVAAIQRYQDDVLGSQISQITNTLRGELSEPAHVVHTKLAVHKASDALSMCHNYLQRTKCRLDAAFLDCSTLRDRIEECRARAQNEVFTRQESGNLVQNKITTAIEQAQKDLSQTLDLLNVWRLLWKVDEISTIVTAAVQSVWCQNLEKELILETGRLSALQRETSSSAFELLSRQPVIQTAILRNQMLQLEASPKYHLSPESLTKPIYYRRNQIIEFPTTRLHIAGQKAVLGMGGGIVTGVGVGWTGWLGWLLGSGEGMFGYLGIEPSTAIGVSMLVSVAGVRWGIRSWEKAKKRWWQDWRRIGEGLERDLKDTLDRTMRQQVTVVAKTACDGVLMLVSEREQEVAAASKQLNELQNSLDCITVKLSPNKVRA